MPRVGQNTQAAGGMVRRRSYPLTPVHFSPTAGGPHDSNHSSAYHSETPSYADRPSGGYSADFPLTPGGSSDTDSDSCPQPDPKPDQSVADPVPFLLYRDADDSCPVKRLHAGTHREGNIRRALQSALDGLGVVGRYPNFRSSGERPNLVPIRCRGLARGSERDQRN